MKGMRSVIALERKINRIPSTYEAEYIKTPNLLLLTYGGLRDFILFPALLDKILNILTTNREHLFDREQCILWVI